MLGTARVLSALNFLTGEGVNYLPTEMPLRCLLQITSMKAPAMMKTTKNVTTGMKVVFLPEIIKCCILHCRSPRDNNNIMKA